MSDREARRIAHLESLRAEAVRRFGPARAEALAAGLEQAAGQLADVELCPVDQEEVPAFYTGPSER
jgi:hypothetical protein